MTKKYTVNQGHSLLMPDGTVAQAGNMVTLDDESAQRHSARVTLSTKVTTATTATTATTSTEPKPSETSEVKTETKKVKK